MKPQHDDPQHDDPELMAAAERIADLNEETCAAFQAEARRLEVTDEEEELAYRLWKAHDAAAKDVLSTPALDGPARSRVMRLAAFLHGRAVELTHRVARETLQGPEWAAAAIPASGQVCRRRAEARARLAEAARVSSRRPGWHALVDWRSWHVGVGWTGWITLPGWDVDAGEEWEADGFVACVYAGPLRLSYHHDGPRRNVRKREVGHG